MVALENLGTRALCALGGAESISPRGISSLLHLCTPHYVTSSPPSLHSHTAAQWHLPPALYVSYLLSPSPNSNPVEPQLRPSIRQDRRL